MDSSHPQRSEFSRAPLLTRIAHENYLVLLVGAAAVLMLLGMGLFVTVDTWLALVAGRVVEGGGPPSTDTLTTWTLGREWIDQQWLGQLALYEIWRAGGLVLTGLVHVAVVIVTFALTLAGARKRGGAPRHVALIGLLALVPILLVAGNIRTQTFAFPLFVGVVWLMSRDSRAPSRRAFWCLPLLVLWANVHGSVLVGAGLVGLAGVLSVAGERRAERAPAGIVHGVGLLAVASVALLATPYGIRVFSYFDAIVANPQISKIASDWMPTTVEAATIPFFLLAGIALAVVGRDRTTLTTFDRLTLGVLLLLALAAGRNLAWFSFAAVLLVPPALTAVRPPRRVEPAPLWLSTGVAALVVAAVLAAGFRGAAVASGQLESRFPSAAAAAVARVADRDASMLIFTHPRYADWLLFRHPRLAGRIPFDIRYELLTQRELRRFRQFRGQVGSNWRVALGGARLVVSDSSEKPLETLAPTSTVLLREPGARQLYGAHHVVVTLRARARRGRALT